MTNPSAPMAKLINQFERLPGIGKKSAQRLAFYVLNLSEEEVKSFSETLLLAKQTIHRCAECCDLTDSDSCTICATPSRSHSTICVVEDSRDVLAIERTQEYGGLYHVLHGAISPINGINPEDLTIKELVSRLSDERIQEIIMATNPTVEGEATAMYLSRLLKPIGVKVTRLAYGIPVGASLEFADEVTLLRALEGRKEL